LIKGEGGKRHPWNSSSYGKTDCSYSEKCGKEWQGSGCSQGGRTSIVFFVQDEVSAEKEEGWKINSRSAHIDRFTSRTEERRKRIEGIIVSTRLKEGRNNM